jgi:hypothetical protein
VQIELDLRHGKKYIPSPWFKYFDEGSEKVRWCQPDGLYIDVRKGLIVLVEVKLKHTATAWWQLEKKYLPVVRKVFGNDFRYALVEVVKWYDPMIPFPVNVIMRDWIPDAKPGKFQVTIWNPKYKK